MHVMKSFFSPLRSRLRALTHTLNSGSLGWGIILLTVAICYLWYFSRARVGVTMDQLLPAEVCFIIPLFLGAFLKARRGALLAYLLLQPINILSAYFVYGMSWNTSPHLLFTFSFVIGGLLLALGAGQLCAISTRLGRAFDELRGAYNALEIAHATIQNQALTDPLTGLPNHRAMMNQLEKETDRGAHSPCSFWTLITSKL